MDTCNSRQLIRVLQIVVCLQKLSMALGHLQWAEAHLLAPVSMVDTSLVIMIRLLKVLRCTSIVFWTLTCLVFLSLEVVSVVCEALLNNRKKILKSFVAHGFKLLHGFLSLTKILMRKLKHLILLNFLQVYVKLLLVPLAIALFTCAISTHASSWAISMVVLAMILFTSISLSLRSKNTKIHS